MHISTYVYLFILPIDNYVRIIYNIDTVKIRNTKTKEILKMNVQEIAREIRSFPRRCGGDPEKIATGLGENF